MNIVVTSVVHQPVRARGIRERIFELRCLNQNGPLYSDTKRIDEITDIYFSGDATLFAAFMSSLGLSAIESSIVFSAVDESISQRPLAIAPSTDAPKIENISIFEQTVLSLWHKEFAEANELLSIAANATDIFFDGRQEVKSGVKNLVKKHG